MNLESERRRDEICLEYEAALKSSRSVQIEDFLDRVPEQQRVDLLAELLPLERAYVGSTSGTSLDEYLRRFPDYEETVRNAFLPSTRGDTSSTALPASIQLSEFEVIRELGRGGMGIVYEAQQRSLNRRVALKVVSPGLGMSANAVMRFRREAQAAGRLHHTNIVPIYSTGEEGGVYYYAMEFIDGPSLDHVIKSMRRGGTAAEQDSSAPNVETVSIPSMADSTYQELADTVIGPYTPVGCEEDTTVTSSLGDSTALRESRDYFDRVASIIAEVAEALEHAHENGVVHRDIKPANLLIAPNGHLSITDFGLARLLEQPGMTMSGELVGSPLYMSPEQIAVGRVDLDHRTDIYSLGVTLYELLTLRPPYPGERRDQVISQILTKEPVRPRAIDRRIPADLETICLKAMEKDPDRRYQRAGLLAEDLKRFVARYAIRARRIGLVGRLMRLADRHRALTTALACILTLLALLAVTFHSAQKERLESAKRAAINRAVRGDITSARELADKAVSLGARPAWRDTVEGVSSLYENQGTSGRAVDVLTRAVNLADPDDSLSARALLATAYVWSGKWSRYKQLIRTLDRELPAHADQMDRFFLGQSLMWHDPQTATELLAQVRADDSWKDSGVVGMVYAESLGHAAWDAEDLAMAKKSIDEARRADSILDDSPMPVAVCNWATVVAVTLSREKDRPEAEIAKLLDSTFRNVQRLNQFADYDIGYPCRAWYYDALNESGNLKFMELMHESVAVRGNVGWMAGMYAAEMFRHNKSEDALSVLNGLSSVGNDPIVDCARVILMLDVANPDLDRVERICRDYELLALGDDFNEPAAWTAIVSATAQ